MLEGTTVVGGNNDGVDGEAVGMCGTSHGCGWSVSVTGIDGTAAADVAGAAAVGVDGYVVGGNNDGAVGCAEPLSSTGSWPGSYRIVPPSPPPQGKREVISPPRPSAGVRGVASPALPSEFSGEHDT